MPPNSISSTSLTLGLEIHVELATRSKMFSRAPSAAHPANFDAPPNSLIDPVVLGLPGALPVLNAAAIELAMMVGMALGCSIAPVTRWDRKSYFYPDLPKNYQISQYQLPLCFDGAIDLPGLDDNGRPSDGAEPTRIGIIRAHLEEDSGKLLHELPGADASEAGRRPAPPRAIDFSIVDYNRAGTPLLEIVTQPDFTSADQAVLFCRTLRTICRFLSATEGILQRGHMRFEPNINTILTLDDGRLVRTPIVEIKNLNSFKALKGAIEFELADQPRRWLQDGRELAPGTKQTRGWDDHAGRTFVQREKEEAQDYRYFPDPDLLPLRVSDEWRESVRAKIPELPLSRMSRYMTDYDLGRKEAAALTDERDTCLFYEQTIESAVRRGVERPRAGKQAANFILQSGAKRTNERGPDTLITDLGISPDQLAAIIALREQGRINSTAADELFGLLCEEANRSADPERLAAARNMLIVKDDAALDRWCDQAIADNPQAAADVRAGKHAAIGRLVGAVMKLAAGAADAKSVRERLGEKLVGRH